MSTSSKLASFLEDGKQGGIKIVIKNAGPAIFFSFSAQLVRPQLLQQRSIQLWEHFAACAASGAQPRFSQTRIACGGLRGNPA